MKDMANDGRCAQLRFWRVPHLSDVDFLHGLHSTHDYPRHLHEEYCIQLVLQGAEITICRGVSYEAFRGGLVLLNPEEAHSSRSIRAEYRIIKLRPKALNRIASEIFGEASETFNFRKLVIYDRSIFKLLLNLHLKLELNSAPLEQESEFISAVGQLIAKQKRNHFAPASPKREAHHVEVIRDYLKAHYAENVPLAQLTSMTNLSPFYLLRVFRKQVGFPPHEYQTQVRIAHARKLMSGGKPILEAALETGFCDQSHFTRNFKRIVGMTPGQYLSQSKIVQDAR